MRMGEKRVVKPPDEERARKLDAVPKRQVQNEQKEVELELRRFFKTHGAGIDRYKFPKVVKCASLEAVREFERIYDRIKEIRDDAKASVKWPLPGMLEFYNFGDERFNSRIMGLGQVLDACDDLRDPAQKLTFIASFWENAVRRDWNSDLKRTEAIAALYCKVAKEYSAEAATSFVSGMGWFHRIERIEQIQAISDILPNIMNLPDSTKTRPLWEIEFLTTMVVAGFNTRTEATARTVKTYGGWARNWIKQTEEALWNLRGADPTTLEIISRRLIAYPDTPRFLGMKDYTNIPVIIEGTDKEYYFDLTVFIKKLKHEPEQVQKMMLRAFENQPMTLVKAAKLLSRECCSDTVRLKFYELAATTEEFAIRVFPKVGDHDDKRTFLEILADRLSDIKDETKQLRTLECVLIAYNQGKTGVNIPREMAFISQLLQRVDDPAGLVDIFAAMGTRKEFSRFTSEQRFNLAYGIQILGEPMMKQMLKERKMIFFLRYSPEELERQVMQLDKEYMPKHMSPKTDQAQKPVLLVVYPYVDENGAFYADGSKFDFLSQYFNVVAFEAGNKDMVFDAVVNCTNNYGKITHHIFGAHGTPPAMRFGEGDDGVFSLEDMANLRFLRPYLENSIGIFDSCSTGENEDAIAGKSAEALGVIRQYAPKIPSVIIQNGYIIGRNDAGQPEIQGVVYEEESTVFGSLGQIIENVPAGKPKKKE